MAKAVRKKVPVEKENERTLNVVRHISNPLLITPSLR
jgi:hypothetical protein